MRLKLVISYDGAPFAGWQSQVGGDAVQDVIEAAFRKIVGDRVVVQGSGRTDAGVHALAQVAHAEVPDDSLPLGSWLRALNANLPPGVRIMRVTRASRDFHARFSATGKVYRYLIRNGQVLPPLELGRVWHVAAPLAIGDLRAAAEIFVGEHDFAAFTANRGGPIHSTVRRITSITITEKAGLFSLRFEGGGFLYKMVRMLTAALVRHAQGKVSLDDLRAILRDGSPKWNHVAPAEGLYLEKVLYSGVSRTPKPERPEPV